MNFKSRNIFTAFPKITLLFALIVLAAISNTFYTSYLIKKQKLNNDKINNILNPFIENLDDLKDLLIESKMYSANWVHLPYELEDKKELLNIHNNRYKNLRNEIENYALNFKNTEGLDNLNSQKLIVLFYDFDDLFNSQKKLTKLLVNFDDYENAKIIFESDEIIEEEIIPKTKSIAEKLRSIVAENRIMTITLISAINKDSESTALAITISSIVKLLFVILAIYFIYYSITKTVLNMNSVIYKLSQGQLTNEVLIAENNIIGDMVSSVNLLNESFTKTSQFANKIEQGDFSAQFNKLSENDLLGEALIRMRNSLYNYSTDLNKKVTESTNEVIEKRKKIEEQKVFYESIFSNIPIEITIYDIDFNFLFINTIGIKDEELRMQMIGKNYFDYCKIKKYDINIAVKRYEIFKSAIETGIAADFEDSHFNKDGKEIYNLRKFYPVFDHDGFKYMIGYGIDITDKKEQEININESLREKEALLGEIHHRVKNNLALVTGLIEMQRAKTDNELIKNQFTEIQQRINAMSLIHEKLYKSNNFIKIDLQDYLKDLVEFLRNFFDKTKNITLHFDLDTAFVSAKRAVPIALIVNELITNSFKYAFLEKKTGSIYIKLTNIENEISLRISDTGPGLSDKFIIKDSKSLGFRLLNIFTKQLKGSFEYYNNPGLNVCIKFKAEVEKDTSVLV